MAYQITSVYSGSDQKKTSKLRVTGFVRGFPTQTDSNAEMFPFDGVIMYQMNIRAIRSCIIEISISFFHNFPRPKF